jgi:hypothetical protein
MAELTLAQIEAANRRGRELRDSVPFASAARYDAASNRIVVDLTNGASFSFPPQLVERLADATPEQLAQVELLGDGYGLGWEELDEHLTVPGLLNGVFGTAKWMARLAGQSRSAAKVKAARANGAKGGRPRKHAA